MKGKRAPLSINYQLGDLEFNTIDWFDDDYVIKGDSKDEDGNYISLYNRQHNKFYTIFGFGVTEKEKAYVAVLTDINHISIFLFLRILMINKLRILN